ncbi:olfactory receptor 11L1-like [Trachemys scripta elegans]|uniref:olfactory receptor 11L1-like n=1 Tax=Trachemys scripta elegans TaxID=31138 RepID=UPI001557651B|nr:olfactory receptor 11L1-like [Trachemys scripta elegans]
MAGNILIIVPVVADQHLHTAMYFFLGNFSCLETCYICTILAKLLACLLTGDKTISFNECVTQFYFFGYLAGTEYLLLSVMSYGFLAAKLGLWIPEGQNHSVCSLQETNYPDSQSSALSAPPCPIVFDNETEGFLLILMSYVCIIATILRILSTSGRQKTFSTCSSHLIVVSIYYATLLTVYMFPTTDILTNFKKVLSVVYAVLTLLVNPLIYSLRNKEVQEALRNACRKFMFGPC